MRHTVQIRYLVDFEGDDLSHILTQANIASDEMLNTQDLALRSLSVGLVGNLQRALDCDCATRITIAEAEELLNS